MSQASPLAYEATGDVLGWQGMNPPRITVRNSAKTASKSPNNDTQTKTIHYLAQHQRLVHVPLSHTANSSPCVTQRHAEHPLVSCIEEFEHGWKHATVTAVGFIVLKEKEQGRSDAELAACTLSLTRLRASSMGYFDQ